MPISHSSTQSSYVGPVSVIVVIFLDLRLHGQISHKLILALHVDAVLIVHASVLLSLDDLPLALRASRRFQSLGGLRS
jgi:hypothetical protein